MHPTPAPHPQHYCSCRARQYDTCTHRGAGVQCKRLHTRYTQLPMLYPVADSSRTTTNVCSPTVVPVCAQPNAWLHTMVVVVVVCAWRCCCRHAAASGGGPCCPPSQAAPPCPALPPSPAPLTCPPRPPRSARPCCLARRWFGLSLSLGTCCWGGADSCCFGAWAW